MSCFIMNPEPLAALANAIDDPEKKANFISEWQDGRSSLNDIGGKAHRLAERLRGKGEAV